MFRSLLFRSAKRQFHVVSTNNIIKPASPTHSSLKHYNLSPYDQFTPSNYIPIVFYYPNNSSNGLRDIACRLKRSLSETLVQYFPFAGRLNSTLTYVDCNDEGVEFQEVNINRPMSEIIEKSNYQDEEALGLVFPEGLIWGNVKKNSPLLIVRLANFVCGGVSIAVCLSHRLGDAKSFYTFITSWATNTRRTNSTTFSEDLQDYSPHFISHTFADYADILPNFPLPKKDWATRRFLFPNSKINKLREMVGLENTTRVEVLTALLYKCFTTVISDNLGFFNPSFITHPINMRHKMLSPLPETSIGNLFWLINISITNENENNLNSLVKKFKKAKMGIEGMKTLDPVVNLSTLQGLAEKNYKLFWSSSMCRIEFYRVDFGWGNPNRVTLADTMLSNSFILMDTPNGDGIEALVALDEQNMIAFQNEILAYSSSPSLS